VWLGISTRLYDTHTLLCSLVYCINKKDMTTKKGRRSCWVDSSFSFFFTIRRIHRSTFFSFGWSYIRVASKSTFIVRQPASIYTHTLRVYIVHTHRHNIYIVIILIIFILIIMIFFFLSWKKKRWLSVFLCVFFAHWLSDYTVVWGNMLYRVAGGGSILFGRRRWRAQQLSVVYLNYYSITLLIIVVYLYLDSEE
jgi:hypothetical protein